MRGINAQFINDLTSGCLSWFLTRVINDNKLSLQIREDYINIYYRGGNALRIGKKRDGYRFKFDEKYCINQETRTRVKAFNSLDDYRENFSLLLSEMDSWFSVNPKPERELQHELLTHNVDDFCILDIEYTSVYTEKGRTRRPRLDMIAVNNGKIIIIENKYGINAMGGKSGVAKHYMDICTIVENDGTRNALMESMKNISTNKRALGLPTADIKSTDVEILFVIFKYNEKSKMIDKQLEGINKRYPAKILYMDDADKIQYQNAQVMI